MLWFLSTKTGLRMMDRIGFQTYLTSSPSSLPSLASAGAASLGGQAAVCLRPEPVWSGRRETAAVTQEKKTEAIHQQRVSEKYISQLFQSFLGSTAMSGSPRNPAQPAPPGVTATMDQLVWFYDPQRPPAIWNLMTLSFFRLEPL